MLVQCMISKEIVQRAITFAGPPRAPVLYFNRDVERSDILGCGYGEAAGFAPSEPGMTEWGYVWHSLDGTMGQPGTHPLADEAAFETYLSPDPAAPGRLDGLAEWIAAHGDKFLRFALGITGFNQATFLRGYAEFLMDLALEPARAARVLDLVFDFENGLIERLAPYALDAVGFGDDWGTQQGLMIAPARWREIFRPRYAEQFARVHRQGKKVWFHTCGNVFDIIGDFIDIGVDVLELLQPDIFGVERLAREFGGKACFCCAVDHQRRAISGTRAEIHAYARLLNAQLGAFNGGFIGYIEDYASLGMDDEHYRWICEAFQALDTWPDGD